MDVSNVKPIGKTEAVDPVKPVKSKAQRRRDSGLRKDKVTLSEQARLLETARRSVKAMEEIDEQKVAEIRARIESGAYRIDSDHLAAKILQESFAHRFEK